MSPRQTCLPSFSHRPQPVASRHSLKRSVVDQGRSPTHTTVWSDLRIAHVVDPAPASRITSSVKGCRRGVEGAVSEAHITRWSDRLTAVSRWLGPILTT